LYGTTLFLNFQEEVKVMRLTEMHLHTSQSSSCGQADAYEIPALYKSKGFDNLTVTDHFAEKALERFKGSSTAQVDQWLEGYRTVAKEGKKLGMRVFLGFELRQQGTREDFLIYGLDEAFLFKNPTLFLLPIEEAAALINAEGGLIFQAHPYRVRTNRHYTRYPNLIQGVEVYNGSVKHMPFNHNKKALTFADKHHLLKIAGSDFHRPEDTGQAGIYLPGDVSTEAEMADYLRHNNAEMYIRV